MTNDRNDDQINEELSEKVEMTRSHTEIIKTDHVHKERLPIELLKQFERYPENKRRPINKTVFNNEYFQLVCHTKDNHLTISSKGDLIYSAIPYDTARNYIQRAAIQSILYPASTRDYIEKHRPNLETYLALSIYQVTGKKVGKESPEVAQAYQQLFEDPLFEMQILGRLLQHDETGPLSANLAGKFLYSENLKTGISAYLAEYIKFVIDVTQTLKISTDGRRVHVLDSDHGQMTEEEQGKLGLVLTKESDISKGLARLPEVLRRDIQRVLDTKAIPSYTQPLLRSRVGNEIANTRKNYVAHSRSPETLEQYFENVLPIENSHQVNVVSDSHGMTGKLPFKNDHFNILVGDVSDSQVSDHEITGIYVIGNHDLADILANSETRMKPKWDKYRKNQWFSDLIEYPDESWPKLPVGNNDFYGLIKEELASRFPKMKVLNNEVTIHKGIRYIGLTIPVTLVERKEELQRYILTALSRLLADDRNIPTVIVSHAPLFNELSMLSPQSQAYNQHYCSDERIEQLFRAYTIIGVIHGHHHIPASFGRYKEVEYADKKCFVVCSIYSKINTGFELESLLPRENTGKLEKAVTKKIQGE